MAYYNPFIPQPRPMQQPQIPFNQQQFAAVAASLNQQSLTQLVQIARQQGISDADIQAGLNYIQSLR